MVHSAPMGGVRRLIDISEFPEHCQYIDNNEKWVTAERQSAGGVKGEANDSVLLLPLFMVVSRWKYSSLNHQHLFVLRN
jgi:hypothetical protein